MYIKQTVLKEIFLKFLFMFTRDAFKIVQIPWEIWCANVGLIEPSLYKAAN